MLLQLYKKAYAGLSREVWLLSLVMLINRSGTMVVPFMTLYLTQSRGYTIAEAGWVMTCFGLGAIGGGLLGGWVADRVGFYYVQIIALFTGGVMFFVMGHMESLSSICFAAFLLAFINDAFRPANAAAIGHYSKDGTATRSFSLNRLSINLGWALGGALGGFFAAHNYHWLFWIDGCTNIVASFFLWLFLAPSKIKNKKTAPALQEPSGLLATPLKDKPYLLFIFFTILFAVCFFQLFSTLPVYYRVGLQLSEVQIGLLMGLNGLLIAAFEMIVVHAIEGKKPITTYMFWGTLFLAASFMVFNIMPGAWMVGLVSILLVTIGEMLAMPFMNAFWVGRTNAKNRGKYAGLFTLAWAIAQVTGPAAGTQVAFHWGYEVLWWMVGGLCVLSAIGYGLLKKTERARK